MKMEKLGSIALIKMLGNQIDSTNEKFVEVMGLVTKSPRTWTWNQEIKKQQILAEVKVILEMLVTLAAQKKEDPEINQMVQQVIQSSRKFVNIIREAFEGLEEMGE